MGLFKKIFAGLKKTKEAISYKLDKLFTGGVLNDDFFDELEMVLLTSDIGAEATEQIMESLRKRVDKNLIRNTEDCKSALRDIMREILEEHINEPFEYPLIIMLVGVNGVGKTTAVGKLAKYFRNLDKSVVIAAADTFRAAASDQLGVWADRAGVKIIKHAEGADAAAVVFDAINSVKAKKTDVLLIDTAGRLHNKTNLMNELSKINKVSDREYPEAAKLNYLVIDATTGQNALSQVEYFDEAVEIDGIVLNKLDGTAKGGIVINIAKTLEIPVRFVGVGEKIDDLEEFDAESFVAGIV